MYYIWSLLVCVIIFALIQYNEYIKDTYQYRLLTIMNLSTFVIIYLILTIVFYMMFEMDYKSFNKTQKGGNSSNNPISADPVMLRKITETVYTGFSPIDMVDL